MKRKIITLTLTLALLLCTLCSCFGLVAERGDVTVVIANRDGTYTEYKAYLEDIENKSEGAVGVIEHLASREKNPLTVDMANSTYGKYVNAIGSLTPDTASGEFISIYTSVESDFGTFLGVKEIEYGGKLLKSSGVGLTDMNVPEGAIILFCIEVYTG
jgi:hypothetical protein